jgi:hypothetical protein
VQGAEINPPVKLRLPWASIEAYYPSNYASPMSVKTIEPSQVSASGPSCRSHGNNFGFPVAVIDLSHRDFSFPRNTVVPTNKPRPSQAAAFLSPFSPAAHSSRLRPGAVARRSTVLYGGGYTHACVAHSPRQSAGLPANSKREGAASAPAPRLPNTQTRCRQTETSLEIFANYFQLN